MTGAREMSKAEAMVRDATEADMAAVGAIYAHYVRHDIATFEQTPPPVEEMIARREAVLGAGMPYLVATIEERVVGYSYATPYRARPAYRFSLEDSVYIDDAFRGRGLGRTLLSRLIERCEDGPWRQMIAVIAVMGGDPSSVGSVHLHEKLGFRYVGTLQAVGYKFGQWVDTVFMQRALGRGHRTDPTEDSPAIERRPR